MEPIDPAAMPPLADPRTEPVRPLEGSTLTPEVDHVLASVRDLMGELAALGVEASATVILGHGAPPRVIYATDTMAVFDASERRAAGGKTWQGLTTGLHALGAHHAARIIEASDRPGSARDRRPE